MSIKNKSQVQCYLNKLRSDKYGPSKISLGELERWCQEHTSVDDDDEDKPVFIGFQISIDEDDDYDDDDDDCGRSFQVVISTKRLMKNATKSDKLHADATYKLNFEGMPVLVVGVSDMDRQFHPCCICISLNEKQEAFTFIFQIIQYNLKNLESSVNFSCLISDSSETIRNAFLDVFGNDKLLIMCWAHMRRNVMKHLYLLGDDESRKAVEEDIDFLQLSSNPEIFSKAVECFPKKWKKAKSFIEYMNKMWFSTHKNWYEGARIRTPSTNNALESFNLIIKNEYTFRERLPLSRFLEISLEAAHRWSKMYLHGDKSFSESTTISLKDWTAAYNWAKEKKEVSSNETEVGNVYYVPKGHEIKATPDQIKYVESKVWATFDQFMRRAFAIWIVTLHHAIEHWRTGSCTCPYFLKHFICKHLLGLAIRLKLIKPPAEAKHIPIGEKRKRGRPKKATKALLID